MRRIRTGEVQFDDALREIARLPTAQRCLLCQVAVVYFSSPFAYGMMDMLAQLPENHPRRLVSKHRVAHNLLQLLQHGAVPGEVVALTCDGGCWHELELA